MTRLTPEHVRDIPKRIAQHDEEIKSRVGASIAEIAERAVGLQRSLLEVLQGHRAMVVPITAGKGIIEGFAEAVASVLEYLGLSTEISRETDVAGFAEAIAKGCDIVFAADDHVFAGFNFKLLRVSYNHEATGKAYAAALDIKAGGLDGKPVALIGAGRVGSSAAKYLLAKKAIIYVYDVDEEKALRLAQCFPERIHVCHSIAEALSKSNLILLAAPGVNVIPADFIGKDTIVSAPAIPIGLTREALSKLPKENLIHDPLELGVATMVAELVKD